MTYSDYVARAILTCVLGATAWTGWSEPARAEEPKAGGPFNFEEASRNVPTPRELYPIISKDLVPMNLEMVSDEMVPCLTDPSKKLRKITARFRSLKLEGRTWVSTCVILMPADNAINETPERRGKVVIIGTGGWVVLPARLDMYADPIVARTGYPVMALQSMDHYDDGKPIEGDLSSLTRIRQKTGKNYYNMNCQLALVYIRAMDAFQEILKVDRVKAVVGGHSKLGRSATVAAAMDPRV
ncbi:MAG: hypothetical protein JW888_10880, partial [Pirellulales bacterium]|nr:hypothetical protein [Pirellulales bacterium]